jgi:hypothetical protein
VVAAESEPQVPPLRYAPVGMTNGEGGALMENWLAAERAAATCNAIGWSGAEWLDGGEAAHLAVFQGEMLATPGYGVSGEAPDPDAQRYYVARRQQP